MSMIGEYLRVSEAELAKVIEDPEWGIEFVEELVEGEDGEGPAEARVWETEKAWHALAFLLDRANFPVDVVYGEVEFTEMEWGYGPPKYLTPERVKQAAQAMADLPFARLIEGVERADLTNAEIYPAGIWDDAEAFGFVEENYTELLPFFQAAAEADQAIVVWIG